MGEELPGLKIYDNNEKRAGALRQMLASAARVPFILIHEFYSEKALGGRSTGRFALEVAHECRLISGVVLVVYRFDGAPYHDAASPIEEWEKEALERDYSVLFADVRGDETKLANYLLQVVKDGWGAALQA